MKRSVSRLALCAALAVSLIACSGSQPSNEQVKEAVKKIMPLNFEIVNVTPFKEIPGLLQVVLTVDKQPVVFYMDKKAKFVFSGSVVELENKKNLTLDVQNTYKGKTQPAVAPAPPAAPAPAAPAAPPAAGK